MNDFEKYLLDNKKQLEPKEVDSAVWLSIENAMLKDKNKNYKNYVKLALVILLATIGAGIYFYATQKEKPLNEERILADLNLSSHKFTKQVNMKKEQLAKATVPQDRIEDFQILLQQLEFMDGQFQDYRTYIEENGYQEFIGEQILNFYTSKIKLLDKIQSEVEKINYYENKNPSNSKKVNIQI